MQKVAPLVFMYSSILFGILGILFVLTTPDSAAYYNQNTTVHDLIIKFLMIDVFVILPSFALSVAARFFKTK